MALADATVITYDGPEAFRDSVSNKFFDSIATDKPGIANYSGFAMLTAQSAGAGFTLNRASWAAAELLELVSDPAVLENVGRTASVLARERFSRNWLAEQLE